MTRLMHVTRVLLLFSLVALYMEPPYKCVKMRLEYKLTLEENRENLLGTRNILSDVTLDITGHGETFTASWIMLSAWLAEL